MKLEIEFKNKDYYGSKKEILGKVKGDNGNFLRALMLKKNQNGKKQLNPINLK